MKTQKLIFTLLTLTILALILAALSTGFTEILYIAALIGLLLPVFLLFRSFFERNGDNGGMEKYRCFINGCLSLKKLCDTISHDLVLIDEYSDKTRYSEFKNKFEMFGDKIRDFESGKDIKCTPDQIKMFNSIVRDYVCAIIADLTKYKFHKPPADNFIKTIEYLRVIIPLINSITTSSSQAAKDQSIEIFGIFKKISSSVDNLAGHIVTVDKKLIDKNEKGSLPYILSELDNADSSLIEAINLVINNTKLTINNLQQLIEEINNDIKNISGRMMFFDVTTQEIENISKFLESSYKYFTTGTGYTEKDNTLSGEDAILIKKSAAKILNSSITTINERQVLDLFLSQNGIKLDNHNGSATNGLDKKTDVFLF